MQVKVKLTYFKSTGKYYLDGEFEMDVRDCSIGGGEIGKNVPYLYDIIKEVRKMNKNGSMPGLYGQWDGPIHITTEPECCPALLLDYLKIDPQGRL